MPQAYFPLDKVRILIGSNGKWIKFLENPTRLSLRDYYRKAIDDNEELTPTQRTEYKRDSRDPTRR